MIASRGDYATPLIAACWGGSLSVAQLLIDRGAKINMRAGTVGSVLAEASLQGEPRTVDFLIAQGAVIDMPLGDGEFGSALIAAAKEGSVEVVELLVARGADVNLQAGSGYGSALSAAAQGPTDVGEHIMKYLIDKGAIVDMLIKTGPYGSALVSAAHITMARAYKLGIVELLVKNGADVNLELKGGIYGTALIAAAKNDSKFLFDGQLDVLNYLIKQGARVNEQPTVGRFGSALAAAASCVNPIGVRLLIDRGADVNLPLRTGDYVSALAAIARENGQGWTMFWRTEQQLAIKRMIDMGADVDAVIRENKYDPAFLKSLELCRSSSIEASVFDVEGEDKSEEADMGEDKIDEEDTNKETDEEEIGENDENEEGP